MQTPRSIVVLGALAALSLADNAKAEVRVHGSEEVLATRTSRALSGDLLFRESSGSFVRLITSIDDPAITNQGDGAFHPLATSEVENALAAIPNGFLSEIDVDIYLLPYPRATCLRSSADGLAIYLSPSVSDAASEAEEHALLTHEIGHLVHRRFLPDSNGAGWEELLALRGIDDDPRYFSGAVHAYRPHEVFAEDFRVLFGSALAAGDGRVENPELEDPRAVHGLRSFMLELAGMSDAAAVEAGDAPEAALMLYPNPLPGDARLFLARTSGDEPRLAIYDLSGRQVSVPRIEHASDGAWRVDLGSARLAAGAYWVDDLNDHAPAIAIRVLR